MPGRMMTVVLVAAVLAAACGGGADGEVASDGSSSTTEASTSTTAGLTASTDPGASTPSSGSPTASSSSASTTATTAAPTTAAPTTAITRPPQPTLLDGGDSYAFTSPSGNIACVMSSSAGASCWIGEKDWTIDQPDGPFCEESDWGNAVDVAADGPFFPCYTDFSWDPTAAALGYGQAVQVGAFRCESAEAGVTCRNGAGSGFRVRRASVDLF